MFLISGFVLILNTIFLLPTFNGFIYPIVYYALSISISVLGFIFSKTKNTISLILYFLMSLLLIFNGIALSIYLNACFDKIGDYF